MLLEEDFYLLEDTLHFLRILDRIRLKSYPDIEIMSLCLKLQQKTNYKKTGALVSICSSLQ